MLFRTKVVALLVSGLLSSPALALNISFAYDASNEFFTEERLNAIERAASVYEGYITNDLNLTVSLLTRADNSALAWGGSGFGTVTKDGKSTLIPHFSTVTFSDGWGCENEVCKSWEWYSGTDEGFRGYDVFSVMVHELGHVLGIGTAGLWANQVSDGYFYGENAVAVYGGPVPLALYDTRYVHWAVGVMSTLPGTDTWQRTSYDPFIPYGQRQYLTDLDLAGLKDIGWTISTVSAVPEPEMLYMLLSGLGIVGALARRQRARAAR